MKAKAAFWDSSAIVPLCCVQYNSFAARQQARVHQLQTVWWATWLETLNTFARLLREKNLTSKGFNQARHRLELLSATWFEISPDSKVRDLAEQVLTQHALSTADGLQLAAALVWCKEQSRQRPFICADIQLSKAAEKIGFDVQFVQ
jgi:predicted nucleic acid-binding protein